MSLSNSSRRVAASMAAVALVAVLAMMATGVFGRGAPPTLAPSDAPPSTAPSAKPTPPPSKAPSNEPTAAPDGLFDVDLEDVSGHDVSARIVDTTGHVAGVASGTPGDGMSVRWFDAKVENVDADTIRIIFVGLPRDEQVRLSVAEASGALHLDVVQAAPPAYSDAVGVDRIIVIDFDRPVSAKGAKVTFAD